MCDGDVVGGHVTEWCGNVTEWYSHVTEWCGHMMWQGWDILHV